MVLLGSARNQDVLPLETLSRSTVVTVSLDEEVAEEIHSGLLERSATGLRYWRHAYDNANGLTLEFTHLLTRGQRLADVIAEQVKARVREHRDTELSLLALVSTAHQWGAGLDLRCVQQVLGVDDIEFRAALERLTDEHLVRSTGTVLTGLHQLRSAALSRAVHAQPPPALIETVDTILPLLGDADLLPFVVGALAAYPDLDATVLDHVVNRLAGSGAIDTWTTALHTLRMVDFHRQATTWADICRQEGVPPALRQAVVLHVLAGIEPWPNSRPEVVAAMEQINAVRDVGSALRDLALSRLGPAPIAATLANSTSSDQAALFLATIAAANTTFVPQLAVALDDQDTLLASLLPTLPIEDLAAILGAARNVSVELSILLMDAAGGVDAVIRELFKFSPWLVELEIQQQESASVACARVLHIADHIVEDIEKVVVDLSKLLARCFPQCQMVDVQAVVPGGLPLMFGDVTIASRRFPVTRDIAPAVVAWNRLRSQIAAAAAGTSDPTLRVQDARALLIDVHRYLEMLTTIWLTGGATDTAKTAAAHLLMDLQQRAENLTLPINNADVIVSLGGTVSHRMDSLSTLITGITSNLTSRLANASPAWPSIATFVGDYLRRNLRDVGAEEQWQLSGTGPPPEIEDLDNLLTDFHAVLAERAWGATPRPSVLTTTKHKRRHEHPLHTAAAAARSAANKRSAAIHRSYRQTLRSHGVRATFLDRTNEDLGAHEWPPARTAILIDIRAISDWVHAHETMQRLLPREIDPQHLGAQPLLVPRLNERPIAALAHYISDSIKPDPGWVFSPWRDALGELYPTPLVDAFTTAIGALTTTSALGTLHTSRLNGPTQDHLLEIEINKLRESITDIVELRPGDALLQQLVEYLVQLADRVEAEVNNDSTTLTSKTMAADMRAGLFGEPSELFNQVMTVR